MNKQIKKEWIVALRSGEYRQGTGRLDSEDSDGNVRHCALGVLHQIAAVNNVIEFKRHPNGIATYGRNVAGANPDVLKWAGIDHKQANTLIILNDDKRWSFKRIARWIRWHL